MTKSTLNIQIIINGIATDPNLKNSNGALRLPRSPDFNFIRAHCAQKYKDPWI